MKRTFTLPVDYPAHYHIANQRPATVITWINNGYLGYVTLQDGQDYGTIWDTNGCCTEVAGSVFDLLDLPARRELTRGFGHLGHHVIYCDPDGSNPTVEWVPV